jgi:hypothetical protein
MAEKKWFKEGNDGVSESKRSDAEAKAKRESKIQRFYLKSGFSGKVVFIDTPLFFLYEHNIEIKGKYGNFFTCIDEIATCPICEAGNTPAYVVAGTVIDMTRIEGTDGKVYQYDKKLFVAKGMARQHLLKQIERRGGDLKFCVFNMARGDSPTECSIGEDFEFVARMDRSKMVDTVKAILKNKKKEITRERVVEYLTPFDYVKVFQPRPIEELNKLFGKTTGSSIVGGASDVLSNLDLDVSSEQSIDDLIGDVGEEAGTDVNTDTGGKASTEVKTDEAKKTNTGGKADSKTKGAKVAEVDTVEYDSDEDDGIDIDDLVGSPTDEGLPW